MGYITFKCKFTYSFSFSAFIVMILLLLISLSAWISSYYNNILHWQTLDSRLREHTRGIFIKQPCALNAIRVTHINDGESFQIWVNKNPNNTPLPGERVSVTGCYQPVHSLWTGFSQIWSRNLECVLKTVHLQIVLSCHPFAVVASVTIFNTMVYFETVSILIYFCFLKFTHRQCLL